MLVPERISPPEASGAPESRLPVCELWMFPLSASVVVQAADEEQLLAEVGQRREHLAQLHLLRLRPWPTTPCCESRCRRTGHASRTGASLAGFAPAATSPQTGSDSSHGRAMVTPTPRSIVRRENWCRLMESILVRANVLVQASRKYFCY